MAYLDLNEDGFNKALELNGSALGGRNIVVIEARPKEKNADGNSGRGNDTTSKRGPERGDGDSFKRGPGRGNGERTTPSKPSVIASAAQGLFHLLVPWSFLWLVEISSHKLMLLYCHCREEDRLWWVVKDLGSSFVLSFSPFFCLVYEKNTKLIWWVGYSWICSIVFLLTKFCVCDIFTSRNSEWIPGFTNCHFQYWSNFLYLISIYYFNINMLRYYISGDVLILFCKNFNRENW